MTARLNPYLMFRGEARAAMEFYQSVFGGELDITTYADAGGMGLAPEEHGALMHAQLFVAEGLTLMGSDVPSTMPAPEPGGHPVSLSGDEDARLRGWWGALSEGAVIEEPLMVAPWGDSFGALTDRFGVSWMVNIAGATGDADPQVQLPVTTPGQ